MASSSRASSSISISSTSPRRRTSFAYEEEDPPGRYGYRPIRRINQACNACRRRKSRCSGGRPCRSCRRLDEPCEYPAPGVRAMALRPPSSSRAQEGEPSDFAAAPSVPRSAMDYRMSVLETRLDDISRQLGELTELTRQLCNAKKTQQQPATGSTMPVDDLGTTMAAAPNGKELPTPIYAASGGQGGGREGEMGHGFNDRPSSQQHWAVKLQHVVPQETARSVFRDYFKYAHNQPYSFFHEASFWTRYESGLLPDHLILAVLSHALRFSGDQLFEDRSKSMSVLFANMAWKAIVHLYFQERTDPDLATVQAITLLSIFDFTAGHDRHDQAWVKIGLAIRFAQDLRLMIDDPALPLGNVEAEERRRVFWSVYMLDRLASCARARPPGVLEASCHLSLPCEEQAWRAAAGYVSSEIKLDDVTKNKLPAGSHPSPLALVMAMTSVLGRCTQCMVQNSMDRPRQAPWEQSSDYSMICSEILTCEVYFEQPIKEALEEHCRLDDGDIDGSLAGPLVFSHILFLLCSCFLYQPFLLRERINSSNGKPPNVFLARGLDSAFEAAKRMACLVRDAKQAGYHPRGSFYGYCLVAAASILAIGVSSPKQRVSEESSEALALCRDMIAELAELWPSCLSMCHVTDRLLRRTHQYASLSSANTLLEPLDKVDRDFMWAALDYNTLCSKTEGFWASHSRQESPAFPDPLMNDFDMMQAGNFSELFPNFQMPGQLGTETSQTNTIAFYAQNIMQ